jgi:large subunit ribosomal protein L2
MRLFKIPFFAFRLKQKGGRTQGRIASKYRGSLGIKKLYRFIDKKRRCFPGQDLFILQLLVLPPNPQRVAILKLPGGFLTGVVLATETLVALKKELAREIYHRKFLNHGLPVLLNDTIADFAPGFSGLCENLPLGCIVFNIEIFPGTGAKLVRSSGTSAVLLSSRKYPLRTIVRLKTGELRKVHKRSMVCLGTVNNPNHFMKRYKNAGSARRDGRRPTVRASAMNPVDHPMGGRTRGGCQSVDSHGKLSRGPSTRKINPKKQLMIIVGRRKAQFLGRVSRT